MSRASCAFAFWYVALDSAEKALGATPQYLFSPGLTWLWWIAVLVIGTAGGAVLAYGTKA